MIERRHTEGDAMSGDAMSELVEEVDLEKGERVAIVGSPSSNDSLTLNLLEGADRAGLVGAMVYVQPDTGGAGEFALGTVTEVLTTNQWHQNPSLLGVVAQVGEIPGLTGAGDVRSAKVRVQAAYRREIDGESWRQNGPSLSMSPPTGCVIRRVTNEIVDGLLSSTPRDKITYLGTAYGNESLLIPFSIRDFAGDRGAFHTGIFGTTGAGKSAFAAEYLGMQLSHENLGIIVVDPQGQFSDDKKTFLPLLALAKDLGRKAEVKRITHDIQLQEDAPLLLDLLAKTDFFKKLDCGHHEQTNNAKRLIKEFTEDHAKKWPSDPSDPLLRRLLDWLHDDVQVSRLIRKKERQVEIQNMIDRYRTNSAAFDRLHADFSPIHNLFHHVNLDGGARNSLWGMLQKFFTSTAGVPSPYLVLDMSNDDEAGSGAYEALGDEALKARVLRKIFEVIAKVAEKSYKNDESLNTMIMLDEAHRYAPPKQSDLSPEVEELTGKLATYARETRKYGIGWCYITQNISSLNPQIFGMLAIRVLGYGLGAGDLRRIEDHVDSTQSLDLYRNFSDPEQTGSYPYMISGPVSPLSFTKAPVFLNTFDQREWFEENRAWLTKLSRSGNFPTYDRLRALSTPSGTRQPGDTYAPAEETGPDGALTVGEDFYNGINNLGDPNY